MPKSWCKRARTIFKPTTSGLVPARSESREGEKKWPQTATTAPKRTIRSKVPESLALMRTAFSVGPFAEIGPHSVGGEDGVCERSSGKS